MYLVIYDTYACGGVGNAKLMPYKTGINEMFYREVDMLKWIISKQNDNGYGNIKTYELKEYSYEV